MLLKCKKASNQCFLSRLLKNSIFGSPLKSVRCKKAQKVNVCGALDIHKQLHEGVRSIALSRVFKA